MQCLFVKGDLPPGTGKKCFRQNVHRTGIEGGNMKKLLNTLYVTSENSYLSLNGENIVIYEGETEKGRVPLHNQMCIRDRSETLCGNDRRADQYV